MKRDKLEEHSVIVKELLDLGVNYEEGIKLMGDTKKVLIPTCLMRQRMKRVHVADIHDTSKT